MSLVVVLSENKLESKESPLILLVMLRIGRMFIHVGGGEDPGVLLSPLVVMMKIYQSESCP